jgi:uncharacterized membrane protein YhhN
MKKTIWIIIFLAFLLLNFVAVYLNNQTLRSVSKPLLMPVLTFYFLAQTKMIRSHFKAWIVFALFFSWLGDIFLMFEEQKSVFFLYGLICFLIAQVFYILFFHNIRMKESIRGNALFLLIVVIYYGVLISVLSPYLGSMKLPVRIYGVVLSFMLMLAMHTILGKNKKAGLWMLIGAVLFVASDSLLAFNKFLSPFNYGGIIIMLTYGLAQLFITEGAIVYINTDEGS